MDPQTMLLLAPVPILGIALIVAVVWLLGGRRLVHFADAAAARRAAAEGIHGFTGGEVLLACNGAGALVRAADGDAVVVLTPLGDRIVSRLIEAGGIDRIAHRRDGDVVELTIRTGDFTMRKIRLRLNAVDAPMAERWLQPLRLADRPAS
jgi:hypothetical protein